MCRPTAGPRAGLLSRLGEGAFSWGSANRRSTLCASFREDVGQPGVASALDRQIASSERDGAHVIYTLTDQRIIEALDLLRDVMARILTRRAALAEALTAEAA